MLWRSIPRLTTMPESEPKHSQLSRLLKQPAARGRVSRAVASLLAASVVSIAVLGALLIWHMVRRGRMIRQRLAPPRPVRWPAPEPGAERASKPTDERNRNEI
jgi:hypothetical protein